MKNIVHITAPRFFGGPQRQILELAVALRDTCRTTFVVFHEDGQSRSFLERVREEGFDAVALRHDTPRLWQAYRELRRVLVDVQADALCLHGYKADLLGWFAGRRLGIPMIAVARGWTAESLRVRWYERLDRRVMRHVDRVVCVSNAMAEQVRQAGVRSEKLRVIRNAIRVERFSPPADHHRDEILELFPEPPRYVVAAAGRLSPEKGFDVLIDAAADVLAVEPEAGFVIFGEGVQRPALRRQILQRGLAGRFVLAGFRDNLDHLLPHADVFVLSSFSEGLPNVVLESMAVEVPVVATAVGGVPELVDDRATGHVVPPGDATTMAARILDLLSDTDRRHRMGRAGRARVLRDFSFTAQAEAYRRLFDELGQGCRSTTMAGAGK